MAGSKTWWEVSNHLEVKEGKLFIAGRAATDIAKQHGTPLYVYNGKRILENYRDFYNALKKNTNLEIRPHYAMKANSNKSILQLLNKEGAWIDAVSPEEVALALEAGFQKEKILFTGTSVSNDDLERLVDFGVRINIDSISELKRLAKISTNVEISFRVDPVRKGLGHSWKVITAGKESHGLPIKFSIPADEIVETVKLAKSLGFKVVGLHEHVGSNWRTDEEVNEFLKTASVLLEKANELVKLLGHDLEFVSFGGGPGVPYEEKHPRFPLETYAREICGLVKKSKLNLNAIAFEPGRYLVADAGLLLVEVVDVKERYGDIIVGTNSGFNHLARPVMYGSYHEIIHCTKADEKSAKEVTIVGNLCETGDFFTPKPRKMPEIKEGDFLAIHNAGAYGFSMASHYNLRKLPKEIVL